MADHVVVIGCGAVGLSIAHPLALRGHGCRRSIVQPGSQTSTRAAVQPVLVQTERTVGSLMHRSAEKPRTFTADTSVPFRLHRVGSVKLALSDWAAGQLAREVVRARALAVDHAVYAPVGHEPDGHLRAAAQVIEADAIPTHRGGPAQLGAARRGSPRRHHARLRRHDRMQTHVARDRPGR